MKIEENINKAKDLLIEYEKAESLVHIMELYKTLSLYSVFLGENLSELKKQYNTCYYTRKIEVSKSYLNNKKEKITDGMSLQMANTENEELFNQESQYESLAMRLDIFLKQINKVLMVMASQTSMLKNEQNRTKSNDII